MVVLNYCYVDVLRGCLDYFFDSLWPFLWPICGRFCELICECLWHVQGIVLGVVWIKNLEQFKGLFSWFL